MANKKEGNNNPDISKEAQEENDQISAEVQSLRNEIADNYRVLEELIEAEKREWTPEERERLLNNKNELLKITKKLEGHLRVIGSYDYKIKQVKK